jgi:hypothetical protein
MIGSFAGARLRGPMPVAEDVLLHVGSSLPSWFHVGVGRLRGGTVMSQPTARPTKRRDPAPPYVPPSSSAPTFTILPVFTFRPPFRPWRTSSHNTSASSRRLLGKKGVAWSDVPPRITPVEYDEKWIKKYTTGKGGEFKKFGRPKFQETQHSHGFGKPRQADIQESITSVPAPIFQDNERMVAEECEGIDPNILDGVYTQPESAEPSYEMDFDSEYIPVSLPFADEPLPQRPQPPTQQWTWGIAAFDIKHPTPSECQEWEAKLRDAMGDDYHPPEIARSRVLNFNRETTIQKPSPRTKEENRLETVIEVTPPIPEKTLWERALKAGWNTDDPTETYVDGVYLLMKRKNQPPRAYFLTDIFDDRGERYFIQEDDCRAALRELAAKMGKDIRSIRGILRFLTFAPDRQSVLVSEVELYTVKKNKELLELLESVAKSACVV